MTPKPLIQGPQTAIVVGPKGEEIHTDKYGRIKVQFHWDRYGKADENSSCWVRISQAAWAGKKWGAMSLPRVGQEVIVEFLEGDPDLPIVTGQVYNADTMPPYDLPANKTMTTLKTNSTKGGGRVQRIPVRGQKRVGTDFHPRRKEHGRPRQERPDGVRIGNDRHLHVVNDKLREDRQRTGTRRSPSRTSKRSAPTAISPWAARTVVDIGANQS